MVLADTSWMENGKCSGIPAEWQNMLFFPPGVDNKGVAAVKLNRARKFCEPCPVRLTCARWHADNRDPGYSAGTSEAERQIIRLTGVVDLKPYVPEHGTVERANVCKSGQGHKKPCRACHRALIEADQLHKEMVS